MKAHQFLAMMIVGLTALPATADEVTVENVHLCCGRCLKDAKDALTGVEGVSKIRVNKTEERILFEATGKDAAHAALKSLAKSGFYGKPSLDGPDFKVEKDAKRDSVSITGLHLCCGGCINGAKDALAQVAGVEGTEVAAKQGKITLSGKDIQLAGVLKALHEAGFHGEVK